MAELKNTLSTTGWKSVIVPTFKAEMLECFDRLAALKVTLPDGMTHVEYNAFLKGRIDFAKYAIGNFNQQLAEYERNKEIQQQGAITEPAVGSPYDSAANPPV
jgi:hypothetical protein